MEKHKMVARGDGGYENYAFKGGTQSSASTNSHLYSSNGIFLSPSDPDKVSENKFINSDVKTASKRGKDNSSTPMKGFIDDSNGQEGSSSDHNEGSLTIDDNETITLPNLNDTSMNPTTSRNEASLFSSKPHGRSNFPSKIFRTARAFISRRLHPSSETTSDSRAERSRDWLFMSVITLVVSVLDKLFDVLFLLTLLDEEEWVFLGLGLTFTVASTITTSFFAAQSFWLQSSQIPTWSSTWVNQTPYKKTVFLHEKFSRPINRRILPEGNKFAEPEIICDTHDGTSTRSSSVGTNSKGLGNETLTVNLGRDVKNEAKTNNSQGKVNNLDTLPNRINSHISLTRNISRESSGAGSTAHDGITVVGFYSVTSNDDSVSPQFSGTSIKVEENTEAPAISGRSTPPDAVDCEFEQPTKQQFQPWVRVFVIAMFCIGLLPESVLVIHLVLYAKAGPKRRDISKMLRETWFVQTLKLAEALLESIPQIHLKMFYYLTRYREFDLAGLLDAEIEWLSSQVLGLLVNAVSICIGLIAILHVHIQYKILAFVFLIINLATRIAVCASLDIVTVEGVYFAPFVVAFVVSASAMVLITVLKCGHYRIGNRKLEKYIGVPVMRTFCQPPVDGPGVAVSAVFVAASIVCGHYISEGSLSLTAVVVVCGAFVGQVVPGLAWHATGISREHQENKRRTSIVRNNLKLNFEEGREAGVSNQ